MDQKFIKFYRVSALPKTGEIGGLYFVYTAGNVGKLYVCTTGTNFELYSGVHTSELTTALNNYVRKDQKIAGIDLQNDITVEELQDALNLGTAAYKAVEDFDAAGAADAVKTALVNGETKFIDFKAVGDELRALVQNAGAKVADVTVGGTSVVNANHVAVLGTAAGKNEDYFVKSEGYVAYSEAEKTKLAGIEAGAEVNIIELVQVNGVALNVSNDSKRAVNVVIPDATVKSVKANDKVLKLEGTELSTLLSLVYETQVEGDASKKYIVLKGINDVEIAKIDASDFIADSFLDNVELDAADNLQFTWAMAGGTTKTDTVNIAKYIDTYTSGNGIDITGKKVSVKRDESSEAFLSVSEAGVKLSGVQGAINDAKAAAKTYTDNSIAALDSTVGSTTVAEGKHVAVEVVETDGKLTGLTITEKDIASDARLAEIELVTSAALNNLNETTTNHETRITNLESTIGSLDTGVMSVSGDLTNAFVKISATPTTGDVQLGVAVAVKEADDKTNYSSTGLATDGYVNEKIAAVSQTASSAVQTIGSTGLTIKAERTKNAVNLELVWQSF